MKTISVRIPDEMKAEMDKLSWVNWSEVMRMTISEKLDEFSKRDIAKALLLNEQLKKENKGESTTEIIRRWRNRDA